MLNEASIRRAHQLAAEGMPLNWIAEDLHSSRDTLQKIVGADPAFVREVKVWSSVWSQIRFHPKLAALHNEFKPRGR